MYYRTIVNVDNLICFIIYGYLNFKIVNNNIKRNKI